MTSDELEAIRKKKAQKLMEMAEKRKQRMEDLKEAEQAPRSVTVDDKFQLMQYFLAPDAFEYWKQLYENKNKNETAETIFVNVLYLIKIGYLEGRQISRIGIKKLERKIEGIPSSITIKRKGDEKKRVL